MGILEEVILDMKDDIVVLDMRKITRKAAV